ncbi:MAG: hypothetical protein AB1791_04175 [Chloroflexota bacterium]
MRGWASGLLYDHLANSPAEPNSLFDVAAWNREWDSLEEAMEAAERDEEMAEGGNCQRMGGTD